MRKPIITFSFMFSFDRSSNQNGLWD